MKSSIRKIHLLAGIAGVTIALASPASAQTTAPVQEPVQEPVADTPETAAFGEIVVTARRREERGQDVPIAISAFSQDALQAQKIEGGLDIQTGVPNLTFAQGQRGDNVTIRGIGTKTFSGASDSATGIHFNGAPMTDNRLFEMDLYDLERLEVLRGPQGTLYGRNATGGVVNVIAAKPVERFESSVMAELTSYEGRKFRAMVNVPVVEDLVSIRLAASSFDREGFVTNVVNGEKIDGRHMYSFRASVAVTPTDTLRAHFTWQRFREDDDRLGTGKGVCAADPGPSSVGGVAVTNELVRGFLSQGCANARLEPGAATPLPNSLTSFFGVAAYRTGLANGNMFAGQTQLAGLDTVAAVSTPTYHSSQDIYQGGIDWDVSDALQVNYLGSYQVGRTSTRQDGLLILPDTVFNATAFAPGGFVNDPQLGSFNSLTYVNANDRSSEQHFHELRVQSDFAGAFNFNLGANYLNYNLLQAGGLYSHTLTAFANFANGGVPCAPNSSCIYIDPNSTLQGEGHNYFLSYQPYELDSYAAFGEGYYQLSDTLKLTAGARFTRDDKRLENIPARLLAPGSGYPAGTPAEIRARFEAVTGRLGIDWKPELSWTDSTLLYGFVSRGYKGGGINPVVTDVSQQFAPEFVNALEIGTKNTLMNGKLLLNASAFYYDYKGYQISKYVNRVSVTENVDASVYGFELEAIARPVRGVQLNLTGGLLSTRISNGTSLDLFDRTQGNPDLSIVKNGTASVCTVPTAALANFVAIVQQNAGAENIPGISGNPNAIFGICGGTYAAMGLTPTQGIEADLEGNQLPNAPNWTVSVGGQYDWSIGSGWNAAVRGDYYRQGRAFARPYNAAVDYLPGWGNLNLSLSLTQEGEDLSIEVYAKNVTNNRAATDYLFNDDSIGLTARAYLREPRIIALRVSKGF